MKVNDFTGPFAADQTYIVDGEYFTDEEICLLYGDYEVVKAKSYEDGLWLQLDVTNCDCYKHTKELEIRWDGEQRVKNYKETSICLGTPDKRPCDCGGYKSRCCLHKENK